MGANRLGVTCVQTNDGRVILTRVKFKEAIPEEKGGRDPERGGERERETDELTEYEEDRVNER